MITFYNDYILNMALATSLPEGLSTPLLCNNCVQNSTIRQSMILINSCNATFSRTKLCQDRSTYSHLRVLIAWTQEKKCTQIYGSFWMCNVSFIYNTFLSFYYLLYPSMGSKQDVLALRLHSQKTYSNGTLFHFPHDPFFPVCTVIEYHYRWGKETPFVSTHGKLSLFVNSITNLWMWCPKSDIAVSLTG